MSKRRLLRRAVLAIFGCLLAVALSVAVNVATGGTLPGFMNADRSWSWPIVGLLTLATAGLAISQIQGGSSDNIGTRIGTTRRVVANLPPRNPNFVGREQLLAELRTRLSTVRTAAVFGRAGKHGSAREIHAIYGSGGVGKSQLALEYAYRFASQYRIKWWIPAEYPELIPHSLAALAVALEVKTQEAEASRAMLALLELHHLDSWLLIFDNADSLQDIAPYLPASGSGGHIVITSRNPNWSSLGHPLEVGLFNRQESIEFLRERTHNVAVGTANVLASDLGDLPLALEQAVAYIEQSGITPEVYHRLFTESRVSLLDRGLPELYGHTVAVTFRLAYARIASRSIAAAQLLEICAFLDPDHISLGTLSFFHELLPNELGACIQDPVLCNDAVAILMRYSMIGRSHDDIRIHRLTQLVIAASLPEAKKAERLGSALRIINSSIGRPFDVRGHITGNEEFALALVSQAEGIPELAEPMGDLLYTVGRNYEGMAVEVELSVPILGRALRLFEDLYGEDHPKVSTVLMNLGLALTTLGYRDPEKTRQGCEYLRRALRIARNQDLTVFGEEGSRLIEILEHNLDMCCRPRVERSE